MSDGPSGRFSFGRADLDLATPMPLLQRLIAGRATLGITRLAEQTGLGRYGMPCFAAIRPNSRTVSVHQGKGADAVSAQLSALMEAAEYAYAEAPRITHIRATLSELRKADRQAISPSPLLPREACRIDDAPIHWTEGVDLFTGHPVLVASDAVTLGPDPSDLPTISQNTNGLAAGATQAQAWLHGLCELIERDSLVLWGFRPDSAIAARAVDPDTFDDLYLSALNARMSEEKDTLRLFDLTTSIGVPTIYAVLGPSSGTASHAEITTGAAAHPDRALAARKATLEAVQTRISLVSGARDDIESGLYRQEARSDVSALLALAPGSDTPSSPSLPVPTHASAMVDEVLNRLAAAGLKQAVAVHLGGAELSIAVEKLFVPGLEDRLTNRHWRPGPRAARAMLGAI